MDRKKKSDPREVILRVKRRIVRVKKNVLIKESKYFDALLTGNYADSNTKEINLTKNVDDMEVLKVVIEFMKTGYISLNDQNIQQAVHLSTYLAIDKLRDKCIEYIKNNLVCEDWLKYYFVASENVLSEVVHYTEAFIASRMHDLLIYEDETLELLPDQLEHLRQKGYLKFCTFDSLTVFVSKWLCRSDQVEDSKLTVALDVLDNAQKDNVLLKDKDIEKDLKESVSKLKKLLKVKREGGKANQVLKILEEKKMNCAVGKGDVKSSKIDVLESDEKSGKVRVKQDSDGKSKTVSEKQESVAKSEQVAKKQENDARSEKVAEKHENDASSGKLAEKHENDTKSGKVTAIFTASERKRLKRRSGHLVQSESKESNLDNLLDGISDMSDIDDDDVVFNRNEKLKANRMIDLCVYDTQSDVWYRLDMFNEREYMEHYVDYFYCWTKNIGTDVEFEITASDTHIVFSDNNNQSKALILDIKHKTWRRFDFHTQLENDLDDGEDIRTKNFVAGRNNMIYLVLCVQITEENENRGTQLRDVVGKIYFRVYHFDIESLEFILIGETGDSCVPKCTDWHRYFRQTNCHISEVRKEMIITHYEGSGLNVVFIVNLEAEENEHGKPETVEGWPEYTDADPREILKKETGKKQLLFKDVEILETENAYLIVAKKDDALSLKFHYLFETDEVKEVENAGTHNMCQDEGKFIEPDKVRFIQAERVWDSKKSLCLGSSLWQIEQYLQFGNVFQEVKYKNAMEPVVIKHRPPPCSSLISVSSAIVDETFFKGLEPVTHFLCNSG